MPDLDFTVESAASEPFAAAPLLMLRLRVRDCDPHPQQIHSVLLHCQVRIEPAQRSYRPAEQENLQELFGAPDNWSRSLCSMLWTHAQTVIPAFKGTVSVDLPLPCSFDLSLAATKYFDGLTEGEVPLLLLFSGTVFYAAPDSQLQAAPIGWDRQAEFRLPVQVWKDLMEHYYPNSAWLCLRRDTVDRLRRYKLHGALLTWDQTLEQLLSANTAEVGHWYERPQ